MLYCDAGVIITAGQICFQNFPAHRIFFEMHPFSFWLHASDEISVRNFGPGCLMFPSARKTHQALHVLKFVWCGLVFLSQAWVGEIPSWCHRRVHPFCLGLMAHRMVRRLQFASIGAVGVGGGDHILLFCALVFGFGSQPHFRTYSPHKTAYFCVGVISCVPPSYHPRDQFVYGRLFVYLSFVCCHHFS